jgi:hypothetical protein
MLVGLFALCYIYTPWFVASVAVISQVGLLRDGSFNALSFLLFII